MRRREDALRERQAELAQFVDAIEAREEQLDLVHRDVQSRHDRARGLDQDIQRKRAALKGELEKRAGIAAQELIRQMSAVCGR